MNIKTIALGIIFCLLLAPIAFAQENIWEMANSDQYGKKAAGMFGRGLLNAATCFVDLIVQTVEGTKNGPPLVGTLTGLGGGIGCTALRATSGVLDVATFWVPGFNGFPVSRSYSNCLLCSEDKTYTPEYPIASQPMAIAPMPSAQVVAPEPMPVTYQAPAPAPVAPKQRNVMDYVKK